MFHLSFCLRLAKGPTQQVRQPTGVLCWLTVSFYLNLNVCSGAATLHFSGLPDSAQPAYFTQPIFITCPVPADYRICCRGLPGLAKEGTGKPHRGLESPRMLT